MRSSAFGVAILAFVVWRQRYTAWNSFLSFPNLPAAFYNQGHAGEDCQLLETEEFTSCEDAAFWDVYDASGLQDRLLVVTCDAKRKQWNTVMGPLRDPSYKGTLWLYRPSSPSDGAIRMSLKGYPANHDFHPLGIAVAPSDANGISNAFVVNHARSKTYIEHFELSVTKPTSAKWIQTISSPYFVSPNALTLTSATSFYVTNDHLMTRRLPFPFGSILPVLETVFAIPGGFVLHVSLGQDAPPAITISALGIPFANGVDLSPSGDTLAVVSTSQSQVLFYNRDIPTNTLHFERSVQLTFCADNVVYADDGELIVAGHPHFPSVINVAKDKPGAIAPSWAAAINANFSVETLYQSNGSAYMTSSTALKDSRSGALYITGLYAPGVLVCRPSTVEV
ncbi:hypothetical protein DL96DRAFT_1704797 [Flagelloscypha sp. PMI_526]|nr:hypothetical protein DL96DRAFT_1704797 [Flagelloscypha sp. PMI_526]